MRKVVVIAVIIATVSVCNAGLKISVEGQIDAQLEVVLTPSDTVVLGIHGDGETASPVVLYLLVQGPGRIEGHRMVYIGNLTEYYELENIPDPIPHAPSEPAIAIEELTDLFPGLNDMSLIVLADPFYPYPPLKGLLVDDIVFNCEGIGDVKLTLASNSLRTTYNTQLIHQIPEPISIALFGVGVLLLRPRVWLVAR